MTSEAKFTKEPLKVTHYPALDAYLIHTKGGGQRAEIPIEGDEEGSLADATLYAAAPDLYEALSEAAKAFRMYEQSHNAKGTVEGAQKAAANAYLAKLCEAALSKATPA